MRPLQREAKWTSSRESKRADLFSRRRSRTGLGAGFVPVRKPKKLPWKTASVTYQLEYGTDQLEIHQDAVRPGQRVLLCDDLLATGGTAAAAINLVRQLGGEVVGAAFAVELSFLNGRAKLPGVDVFSLLKYDS